MAKPTPVMDRITRRSFEAPCLVKGLHPTCWVWRGAKSGEYGSIFNRDRSMPVHRITYEAFVDDIPCGLKVVHLCRNPWHLQSVTPSVAALRGNGPRVQRLRKDTKTHCVDGHEFTEENSGRDKQGGRFCRECRETKNRDWHARWIARSPNPPRTSESRAAEAAECRRLRSEGMRIKEIAGLLGLAQSTVFERLRATG
jgi:hypothetical protein